MRFAKAGDDECKLNESERFLVGELARAAAVGLCHACAYDLKEECLSRMVKNELDDVHRFSRRGAIVTHLFTSAFTWAVERLVELGLAIQVGHEAYELQFDANDMPSEVVKIESLIKRDLWSFVSIFFELHGQFGYFVEEGIDVRIMSAFEVAGLAKQHRSGWTWTDAMKPYRESLLRAIAHDEGRGLSGADRIHTHMQYISKNAIRPKFY